MEFLLELLKDWTYEGKEYPAGDQLRIKDNQKFIKGLIKDGVVKLVEGKLEDDADADADSRKGAGSKDQDTKVKDDLTGADIETVRRENAELKGRVEAMEGIISKAAITPETDRKPVIQSVHERWTEDPTLGYGKDGASLFFADVVDYGTGDLTGTRRKHFDMTQRYLKDEYARRPVVVDATKGYVHKAIGSDEVSSTEMSHGGALMPVEFRMELFEKEIEPSIARGNGASAITIGGTSVSFPVLKDFDRSGGAIAGVTVQRDHERTEATATRPEFRQFNVQPQRCSALAHATGYSLNRNPALGDVILRTMAKAMAQKENREFIRGDGGGEPKGVINLDGKKSVTRTTSNRIGPEDILTMWSHQFGKSNCVWIAGLDTVSELYLMSKTIGTAGSLVMMNGITGSGPMTIMGRPLIFSEFASALGSEGDILCIDWSQYTIVDSGYRKNDRSIFVRFAADEETFRVITYNMADSHWPSVLTTDQSHELSPFVTLAA